MHTLNRVPKCMCLRYVTHIKINKGHATYVSRRVRRVCLDTDMTTVEFVHKEKIICMSSLFKQLKINLRWGSESCDLGYVSTTYVETKEERLTELENKECTQKKPKKTKKKREKKILDDVEDC